MLPSKSVEILEYLDDRGRSPFGQWLNGLGAEAAARIAIAVTRLAQGNFSNLKGVGSGVFEQRIDFGPGLRVYLGKDAQRVIILLGGGTKKRQQRDISEAIARWQDYKKRKLRSE